MAAIDKVVFRYRRQGAEVRLSGLDAASSALVDRAGKHDKTHLPEGVAAHCLGTVPFI